MHKMYLCLKIEFIFKKKNLKIEMLLGLFFFSFDIRDNTSVNEIY